jgi:hypothetical protein
MQRVRGADRRTGQFGGRKLSPRQSLAVSFASLNAVLLMSGLPIEGSASVRVATTT